MYEQDRGICNPQSLDESSEHRAGSGIPLLPNSFGETEWLVPLWDDTTRLKACHAYDQWKQESAVKLKANPDYRSKCYSPEESDAQSPLLPKSSKAPRFKDTKWVVRPKGNSAWKKAGISFAQRKMTSNVSNPLARDETDLRFDRDNTFHLIRQWTGFHPGWAILSHSSA